MTRLQRAHSALYQFVKGHPVVSFLAAALVVAQVITLPFGGWPRLAAASAFGAYLFTVGFVIVVKKSRRDSGFADAATVLLTVVTVILGGVSAYLAYLTYNSARPTPPITTAPTVGSPPGLTPGPMPMPVSPTPEPHDATFDLLRPATGPQGTSAESSAAAPQRRSAATVAPAPPPSVVTVTAATSPPPPLVNVDIHPNIQVMLPTPIPAPVHETGGPSLPTPPPPETTPPLTQPPSTTQPPAPVTAPPEEPPAPAQAPAASNDTAQILPPTNPESLLPES